MQSSATLNPLATQWLIDTSIKLQAGLSLNLVERSPEIIQYVRANRDAAALLHFIATLQKIGCPNALIIQYALPKEFKEFQNQKLKEDIFDIIKNIKNPYVGVSRCNDALSKDHPVGFIIQQTRRPHEWGMSQEIPAEFRSLRYKFNAKLVGVNHVIPVMELASTELPLQLQHEDTHQHTTQLKVLSCLLERLTSHRTYIKIAKRNVEEMALYLETAQELIDLFEIYPALRNAVFVDSPDFLTPLHVAIIDGSTPLALYLIKNGADINAHSDKFGFPYEAAASFGDTTMIAAFLETYPNHAELRQGVITHACVRMYELTKNNTALALHERVKAFMQLLDLLCQYYHPKYVRACMKVNFGSNLSSTFKHALIAQMITHENDDSKAKVLLQQAEDKDHPLSFVMRLDENFLYPLRNTAKRIKAEKARLNSVIEMEPLDDVEIITGADPFADPEDEASSSPFGQQTNGDDDLKEAVELGSINAARPGLM